MREAVATVDVDDDLDGAPDIALTDMGDGTIDIACTVDAWAAVEMLAEAQAAILSGLAAQSKGKVN